MFQNIFFELQRATLKYCLSTAICGIFMLSACNKNNDNIPVNNTPPSISGISPDNGVFNTVVVISGANFTSKDTVKFNGKTAEVVSASATQISVKVPALAGSGNVTIVTTDNKTANGPSFQFQYTATATTFAGNGIKGYKNGIGSEAQFSGFWQLCFDNNGNLYLTEDDDDSRIRKVSKDGTVSTYASGRSSLWSDFPDGPIANTKLYYPFGLAVNKNNEMFLTEGYFIRRIKLSDNTIAKFTGSFNEGYKDGTSTEALFDGTTYISMDALTQDMYVFDENNRRIRKVSTNGSVSTIFGDGISDIDIASMTAPKIGGVYIAGWKDCRIRHLSSSGVEKNIAGANELGYKDGKGADARFRNIIGISEDPAGNLFVADRGNNRIRMIDKNGNVFSVAGNGEWAFQDGTGDDIKFAGLEGLVSAEEGVVYVIDRYRIRKVVVQ